MVEAAIVLPILILTILSMILLMIYYFSSLKEQTDVHQRLIDEADRSAAVFILKSEDAVYSQEVGGVISMMMHNEKSCHLWVISESDIIRAGDFFEGDS